MVLSRNPISAAALVAAVGLATAATVAFHLSPQVPLGVPWNESRKVEQILGNSNAPLLAYSVHEPAHREADQIRCARSTDLVARIAAAA
jgi:hypothetical protein